MVLRFVLSSCSNLRLLTSPVAGGAPQRFGVILIIVDNYSSSSKREAML